MANEWMMPMAALAASNRRTRRRVRDPLLLTLVPGAPAVRSAVAAVAVTQQAEQSLRRERRVAEETAAVVDSAARGTAVDRAALEQVPALRDVASDQLAQVVQDAAARTVAHHDQRSLQRQRDVATAVAEFVRDAPPGQVFDRAALQSVEVLKDVATDELAQVVRAAARPVGLATEVAKLGEWLRGRDQSVGLSADEFTREFPHLDQLVTDPGLRHKIVP